MGLKEDVNGRWPEILAAAGVPTSLLDGKHQACPLCITRPSRKVNKDRFRFTDYQGDGNYFCNQCGPGNGLTLLMGLMNWPLERAIAEISRLARCKLEPVKAARQSDKDVQRQLFRFGRHLQAIKPHDPVHTYLLSRGLDLCTELRIHPGADLYEDGKRVGTFPVMVGLFMDHEGVGVGYHRTFLLPDGKTRKVLGRNLSGCAIRLSPIAPIIGLAEGIETALSVTRIFGLPCWAAYSKDNLRSFIPPAGVERVRIFADSDESFAGQLGAVQAAYDLHARGVAVELHPFLGCGDWNDKLMERKRYGSVTRVSE